MSFLHPHVPHVDPEFWPLLQAVGWMVALMAIASLLAYFLTGWMVQP